MRNPLATLSFEMLQRRWTNLRQEDVERLRSEEQLIAFIARHCAEDPRLIRRKLKEARRESLLSLPVSRPTAPVKLQYGP